MSKHDIDSINAAIILGDHVMPPTGAIIKILFMAIASEEHRVVEGPFAFDAMCTCLDVGYTCLDVLSEDRTSVINTWVTLLYQAGKPRFYITYIPEDAPPFAEWYRYGEIK
jgi:hypothetical protein